MYTVDYFIKKFEAIPEEKWGIAKFEYNDTYCANGHCGVTNENHLTPGKEALSLDNILRPCVTSEYPKYYGLKIYEVTANINDGHIDWYKQPTPKQRILAALYDVKKMQPVYEDISKDLAILPVNETSDLVGAKKQLTPLS